MTQWAAAFDVENAKQIGMLRYLDGVKVRPAESVIWVTGTYGNERDSVIKLLSSLACKRFEVLDESGLTQPGDRVPVAELPDRSDGQWQPICEWVELTLPAAQVAQGSVARVSIGLVRSNEFMDANAILSTIEELERYVDSAPEFRLSPLTFAMNESGSVFVRGEPLPSIPGQPFVEQNDIAWPAGFEWSPQLSSATIREAFELDAGALLILHHDGSWESIDATDWIPVRRSAVRESLRSK
jgi:hypothetical protein